MLLFVELAAMMKAIDSVSIIASLLTNTDMACFYS